MSTAGSSGVEISFRNVEDAAAVRETITRLSNEYSDSGRLSAGDGRDGSAAAPTAERMDELVAELRATR